MTQPQPPEGGSSPTFNALVYGAAKRGKTAIALAALPTALCIGNKSAIELVGREVLGFTPAVLDDSPTQLEDLTDLITELSQDWTGAYGGLLLDDISLVLDQSMMLWAEQGGSNSRYKFLRLMSELTRFSAAVRDFPGNVVQGFHEITPQDGEMGGPKTPSKNRKDSAPPWADFVARVASDPESLDPWWSNCFHVNPLGPWISGSRLGKCWDTTPANLRAICALGQGNYDLRRPTGLEWIDDLMRAAHAAFKADPPKTPDDTIRVGQQAAALFLDYDKTGPDMLHIQWGLRDGLALHIIEAHRSRGPFSRLTIPKAPMVPGAPPPPPE